MIVGSWDAGGVGRVGCEGESDVKMGVNQVIVITALVFTDLGENESVLLKKSTIQSSESTPVRIHSGSGYHLLFWQKKSDHSAATYTAAPDIEAMLLRPSKQANQQKPLEPSEGRPVGEENAAQFASLLHQA